MVYLTLVILIFITAIFTAIKDRSVRVSKWCLIMVLGLFCIYLWHIKWSYYFAAFFAALFLIDEWLSLIPKIEKYNRARLMGKSQYRLVQYKTLCGIIIGEHFNFANNTDAFKTHQTEIDCTFTFQSDEFDKTGFFLKDFCSTFKVLKGVLKITIKDEYDAVISSEIFNTGETAIVKSYAIHSIETLTKKTLIRFIATR